MKLVSVLSYLAVPVLVTAQLSGSVGPTTNTGSKRAHKQCNVLDYGARADKSTDLGPALSKAWSSCAGGGVVVIPAGDYAMRTWSTLDGGRGVAIQLDGIIYRTGTAGGTMIVVQNSNDFELYSSTGKGAVQGYGYIIHQSGSLSGARILRLIRTNNFSVHDLALVDAPAFHMFMDHCNNGEVYNMLVRGGDHGGLDGIDLIGDNVHIHDVMVTNRDECVTVKSPSSNLLIEQIYCNWSGGSAIGSLGAGTAISRVTYQKVYSTNSNQMMLIKSNGGSGYVRDVAFNQFIGHGNAYSLDIDQLWSGQTPVSGNGVQLSNIRFNDWKGTCASGAQRAPIQVKCASGTPCTGISISDFAMWTNSGNSEKYYCANAYGSGGCLRSGSGGAYSTTQTITRAPSGYAAPTLPDDLRAGFGFTQQIPIPSFPRSFYPGTQPLVALNARG